MCEKTPANFEPQASMTRISSLLDLAELAVGRKSSKESLSWEEILQPTIGMTR